MFTKQQVEQLSTEISAKIISIRSVSGGDIANSYLLTTDSGEAFLKTHENYNLLEAEKTGLAAIAKTNTIKTPEILGFGSIDNLTFLALEWVDTKPASKENFELFGKQLAALHQQTQKEFGFSSNNFIGHLQQSNKPHDNWNDFYIEERLLPQLRLAKSKGLLHEQEIPSIEMMKENCFKYFNTITPSLLHGDLWNGNYFISQNNGPYIFDPSTYFGHSEIDIAMSKLFGGFDSAFYTSYYSSIPKDEF